MPATTHHPLINYQSGRITRPTGPGNVARVAEAIRSTLRLWSSRFNDRRVCPVLDERELHDLGLSRWDVERELAKPFWRG
jgi:uncharacterized protein YjiS (DUF1127 family)